MNLSLEKSTYPVFLGLGSNLGDRMGHLSHAVTLLENGGFEVTQISAAYETPPWGLEEQPAFLNQVVEGKFGKTPFDLLELAMSVEVACGRERLLHWGPRVLDIDILAFDQLEIHSQRLTVPHPYLSQRAFVLLPWAQIAPGYQPAGYDNTILEMLQELPEKDKQDISLFEEDTSSESEGGNQA